MNAVPYTYQTVKYVAGEWYVHNPDKAEPYSVGEHLPAILSTFSAQGWDVVSIAGHAGIEEVLMRRADEAPTRRLTSEEMKEARLEAARKAAEPLPYSELKALHDEVARKIHAEERCFSAWVPAPHLFAER